MKLNEAIRTGKFNLTEYEKEVLNAIRDQGSFYEESLCGGPFEEVAFLGYQLTKKDVNNKFDPSGVVASLVKKGVLEVGDPIGDGSVGYWIRYELEFDPQDDCKILFTEPQKKVTKYVYRIEIVNHIPPQAGLDFDYEGYFKRWVEEFKNPVIKDYIVTDELLKPNEVLVNGTFGYIFKVGSLATTFEEVK